MKFEEFLGEASIDSRIKRAKERLAKLNSWNSAGQLSADIKKVKDKIAELKKQKDAK